MPTQSDHFLRIDETPTEEENDRIVLGAPDLQCHLRLIHTAYDLLPVIVRHAEYKTDAELYFLRLAIRLFNSGSSALKLARSGYYQPALSMVRDIVEMQFLIDLFRRDPKELECWVTLPPQDREKRFKPFEVRKKLDEADGLKNELRAEAYKQFCQYAAHPTPEGFRVISPEGLTKVGPFPSEKALGACIEELAKHFSYACFLFSKSFESSDEEVLVAKARFVETYQDWAQRYLLLAKNDQGS